MKSRVNSQQCVSDTATVQRAERAEFFLWRTFVLRYPPDWIVCLIAVGVALCFNLYRLGEPSLWFDEILSVQRASQPLPVLERIIFATQPNMALYYVLLHYWLKCTELVGLLPQEFVVRFPSAVLAALSASCVFLVGRRFLGRRAGIASVILYILNALQLTYAQETRSYSMQILLICIAWYALFVILSNHKYTKRWWICYILATTFALYTQLFSVLIVLTQGIFFVCLLIVPNSWHDRAKRQLLPFLGSSICAGIASLPLLTVSLHAAKTGWLPAPTLQDLEHLFMAIGGGHKVYLCFLGIICLFAIVKVAVILVPGKFVPISAWYGKRSYSQQIFPVMLALVCWCVVPVVISFIVSLGSLRLFSIRYLVVIVPPVLLLAGSGISLFPGRRVQLVVSVFLLITACFPVLSYYQSAQVEDWKEVTAWLQQQDQVEDGMLCYDNGQGCQLCIEYYLHAYPRGVAFPTDTPGYLSWVDYDLTNQIGDPGLAVDTDAIAAYGAKHTRIFFITARLSGDVSVGMAQNAQNWLDKHYQLKEQIVRHSVTIRLYQTTAVLPGIAH